MESQIFEKIQRDLDEKGADSAIDNLCEDLRQRKDYHNLFYAMLMKKRHQLGVSVIPTSPALRLPPNVHQEYEEAIRDAARTVGALFLKENNIAHAFSYFNMINEREPLVQALEKYVAQEGEDCEPIVNIAYHQGVHPKKGFDFILKRYGICSAITTLSGNHFPFGEDVRDYCIKKVVRALYDELRNRLRADIQAHEGITPPQDLPVVELIKGRTWLFGEDIYHVDISHLSAVVQMSVHLGACEELNLSRELCEYGQNLSPRMQYHGDPPFEDQYRDYGVYLSILAGEDVETGLNHFRAKVEKLVPEEDGTYPVEVLVNLLLKVGREQEALQLATRYLVNVDERQLTCPGIVELCERTFRFDELARLAKQHNNPVHYLAGLISAKGKSN